MTILDYAKTMDDSSLMDMEEEKKSVLDILRGSSDGKSMKPPSD